MEWMLNIDLKKLPEPIRYGEKILLIGSCFTEHIGNALLDLKFDVLQNPNGILFGPDALSRSLSGYISNRQYRAADLFQLNEVWHSWDHHSRFSDTNPEKALTRINESQQKAHSFLQTADCCIITLGSSFIYELTEMADRATASIKDSVANCHRAPAAWFNKKMLEIPRIIELMESSIRDLRQFNPSIRFIFTISPVRHIRDGVVENNRSKARLIEAVHHIVSKTDRTWYFPAYELVIDVLRDYRFYDIDLVHPNYPATEFVLEKFTANCIDEEAQGLMKELSSLVISRKHRPMQPDTASHRQFLRQCLAKAIQLKQQHPFLDLDEEIRYFSA